MNSNKGGRLMNLLSLRPMSISDYDEVLALWSNTPGLCLTSADGPEAIAGYLERNPQLSLVCTLEGRIIGALLAGHDGRRGFLHHLCVEPAHRRNGIARMLVDSALSALKAEGIDKCHLFVLGSNEEGMDVWRALGWQQRRDIVLFSREY